MQFRRATAARWTAVNEVLQNGQPGFESDTGQLKIGDGISPWSDLSYIGAGGGPHAVSHENGGTDEIDVTGLSGLLATPQTPAAHVHDGADITTGTVAPARLGSGSGGATKFLREDSSWQTVSGGSGDNITINGAALVDADFDDATPAPPAGEINVKWQKDAGSPANVSASVQAATTAVKGVVELATDGESAANVVVQGNDARMSNARTPLAHEHTLADITDAGTVAAIDLSGDATEFLRGDGTFEPVSGVPTTRRLNTQHDVASTTGTEVTDLSVTLVAGTYVFTYYLITQAANTTVGMSLGINYTGTMTRMGAFMRYCDTGTTAVTGIADNISATGVESIHGNFTTNSKSTTTPDMGPLTNHVVADANTLVIVDGIMVVSDGGDIELWHASDAATTTRIMVGSSLILTRTA